MKQAIFIAILVFGFAFSVFGQSQNQLCVKTDGTAGIVEAGTPMKFVATLSGKTDNLTLGYEWKVSAGTITSGQGTCAITVDTTGLANGTNVTAEVTVKGLPPNCPSTASETGSVVVTQIPLERYDEFGGLPNDEVRARMDAVFVALGNEPNGQGYIVNYGTAEQIARREKLIRNHIAFRKYDINRITFVKRGANPFGENTVYTRIWILMPGTTPP
ncbi:MAG TPA: hypothetical protein VIL74_04790 [Pyrinomonadaceae bacterium]|jgi:hypothetical protein